MGHVLSNRNPQRLQGPPYSHLGNSAPPSSPAAGFSFPRLTMVVGSARGGGHEQSVGYGRARSLGYNADIRGCTGASHRPNSTDRAPNRIISTIMIGKS